MNATATHPVTLDDGITLAVTRAADAILHIAGEGVPIERAIEIVRSSSCLGTESWKRVIALLDERRTKKNYVDTMAGFKAVRKYADY